jgi:hypothetical protein
LGAVHGKIEVLDVPIGDLPTALGLDRAPPRVDPDPVHAGGGQLVEHLDPLGVGIGGPPRVELHADLRTERDDLGRVLEEPRAQQSKGGERGNYEPLVDRVHTLPSLAVDA